jgi:prephenate dehydrogenase
MKIAIIGAGRMGTWLVRELSRSHGVGVHDLDPTKARASGAAAVFEDPGDLAPFRPDILINAASLPRTIEAYEAVLPHLPPGCILADIASVKGKIPDFYNAHGFRFASVHPMFGPTFANVGDLRNESAVVIKESDEAGALFFRDFFGGLGLKIFEFSFEEHDRMIAYSLSVPFTSTLVFAASTSSLSVPGTTFKKHLEIARGLLSESDDLLSEILFNTHTLPQLDMITGRLELLKHIVRQRDSQEASLFFDRLRTNIGLSAAAGPDGGRQPGGDAASKSAKPGRP